MRSGTRFGSCAALAVLALATTAAPQETAVDLSGYRSGRGVEVRNAGERLEAAWPMEDGEHGRLVLDLRRGRPLIERLGISKGAGGDVETVLRGVDPVTFVTVGTRHAPSGRPPLMSIWNTFFDGPASRPHETFLSRLDLRRARVTTEGNRTTIALGDLTVGPFSGELCLTLYPGGRLVHVEAVVSTREDRRAILYDAGLAGDDAGWKRAAWIDTGGRRTGSPIDPQAGDRPLAVRHRTLAVEGERGSLACFPPPHQFFYPTDWTDNLKYVWMGRGHHGRLDRFGIGIRQHPTGRNNFVPWFNAPPGTRQRLGVFYLLTRGNADAALRQTLRYTHGDRFPKLPGYRTLTSHWHMAIAVAAMQRPPGEAPIPDFVTVFKQMGVDAVHLAEFHGDGHQQDPGPLRLPEMKAMFAECRRLSDRELLLIPGEELSGILGVNEPGKHPGHWMSLFPKPVYFVQQRPPGQPFREQHPEYGTVYRIGGRDDMAELLRRERGLAWTAHPRIKASSWTPDIFRREPFYLEDFWLGAAWKAMPADLSRPRLGERGLDLLSDMANWGQTRYMPGEVDVFKIDRTHELYGHMNVNYVRLDRLPRFDEGWSPVVEALRGGRFFVTTGEVLIRDFTVGGRQSGATVTEKAGEPVELRAALEWTFPLRFAEVISGDGERVYRERIDLSETRPFGTRTLLLKPDLRGRKWVRLEVWDVAANGAFTQPVWLREGGR